MFEGQGVGDGISTVLFTWRFMGLSSYSKRFITGVLNLLVLGLTPIRPLREVISRVISPAIGSY